MTKRHSIQLDGVKHGAQPIPAASRIGPFIVTGGVSGRDLDTNEMPEDVSTQAKNAFATLGRILRAADASLDDVIKVTVYLNDRGQRTAINDAWLDAFPDPTSRPARHTLVQDLTAPLLIQIEAMAVVSE
jgi:2-iminobutanoate/2-iminopropanoate deaminase